MKLHPYYLLIFCLLASCNLAPDNSKAVSTNKISGQPVKTTGQNIPEEIIKDQYQHSDVVAHILVTAAKPAEVITVVSAQVLNCYKGQLAANTNIKYEAFMEEGNYNPFINKQLIIFLKKNATDKNLFKQGVHYGRTEPNVEYSYNTELESFIKKLK